MTSTAQDVCCKTAHVVLRVSVDASKSTHCWWDTDPIVGGVMYRCPVQFSSAQKSHVRNGYRFNESVPCNDEHCTTPASVEYVGAFCSLSCCLAWAKRESSWDPMYSNSVCMINMYAAVTRPDSPLPKPAPSMVLLKKYGGELSTSSYRALSEDRDGDNPVQTSVDRCPLSKVRIAYFECFGSLMSEMKSNIREDQTSFESCKDLELLHKALRNDREALEAFDRLKKKLTNNQNISVTETTDGATSTARKRKGAQNGSSATKRRSSAAANAP